MRTLAAAIHAEYNGHTDVRLATFDKPWCGRRQTCTPAARQRAFDTRTAQWIMPCVWVLVITKDRPAAAGCNPGRSRAQS